jgi:1,4-dihydroxy-6-naphthoate synthase
MTLTFGFSPCPNDTFMFEPIVNERIDLMGLKFKIELGDVEHLNKKAINHIPDITKLSFNAFTKVYDRYQLLDSGSALGNNCGPLLISKKTFGISEVNQLKIAVPGYNTTAFLLLKYAFPHTKIFKEVVFSDVEDAVVSGDVDAGVIIHENRFTYPTKGLHKIMDLGEHWEQKTGSPIPLGGIAIKTSLPEDIKLKVNQILYNSIQFAFANPDSGRDYIRKNAQEMDESVMFAHINLYVNQYSQSLGDRGKNAIRTLFEVVDPHFDNEKFDRIFIS